MTLDITNTDRQITTTISKIPDEVLWMLLLYGTDYALYKELGKIGLQLDKDTDRISDIVAKILCDFIKGRIKRNNLNRGFITNESIFNHVHGHINIFKTEMRGLNKRRLVSCTYEKQTFNTVRNCFARTALNEISKLVKSSIIAEECKDVSSQMRKMGIIGQKLTFESSAINHFALHEKEDRVMIGISKLAINLATPTDTPGSVYLPKLSKERIGGWQLFERGIAGIYKCLLPEDIWNVRIQKPLEPNFEKDTTDKRSIKIYPDIVIENIETGMYVIVDTKFKGKFTKRGSVTDRNQVSAYMSALKNNNDLSSDEVSGLLVYPSFEKSQSENYNSWLGNKIVVLAINLCDSTNNIRKHLIDIVAKMC